MRPRAESPAARRLPRLACAAAAVLAAGCSPPAFLVVSAGFNAMREGTSAWANGELAAAEVATLGEMRAAAVAALRRLQFDIRADRDRGDAVHIEAMDDRTTKATVGIFRRTGAVSKVRIRVGVLGDQSMSRLILQELLRELERARARPAEPGGPG